MPITRLHQSSVAGGRCYNVCTAPVLDCAIGLQVSDNVCACAACNDGSIPTNYGCPVSYCYGSTLTDSNGNPINYDSNGNPIDNGASCTCTTAVFPPGLTVIAAYAFYKCTKLTSVIIPAGVEVVGNFAFYGCTSLTSLIIPAGVTTVGVSAFAGCTSLTSVTISNGVVEVWDYAFNGCSFLTSVTIPPSVIYVGYYAFYSCSHLSCVSFAKNSAYIEFGNQAFFNDGMLSLVYVPKTAVFYAFPAGIPMASNVFDVTKTTVKYYGDSDSTVQC